MRAPPVLSVWPMHDDMRLGVALEAVRKIVEHGAELALDVGAVGVKGHICGNGQLELVVWRATDGDARAACGGFQLLALALHIG